MTTPDTSHSEDAILVARATSGDREAFRRLYELYGPLVHRLTLRMLGSPDDAADMTQDVFLRAFTRLGSLRDGQAFQAWITRMTVNMLRDRARRKSVPTVSLDAPPPGCEEGAEWCIPADDDCESRVLTREQCGQVRQAILALSPDHRMVVVLFHMEGIPVEEVARMIGVPEGTVKSRLSRARAELKRLLEGAWEA
jgi:RNA polymerase sigma-70 factor (ECF subfamily)